MSLPNNGNLALKVRGVSHWFGPKKVLADINLDVQHGQFMSLVGPSGCGKSTLLRAIVGTHLPRQGEILVHRGDPDQPAQPIDGPGRDRGIVYQHYSLFPFLTALENVAIGPMLDETTIPYRWLKFPKWRALRRAHLNRAKEYLEHVKLTDAMHLYPHEMSGGMRQRVAIAQALVMKPKVILLDEPFGALDEATREDLQKLLLTLYSENQTAKQKKQTPPYTLVIVTHELSEAIYVGDRLVGLSQYWDWKGAGYPEFPGATIIYDKKSRVFEPHEVKEFEMFEKQREEIRHAVFDPSVNQPREEHRTYWQEVQSNG